MLGLVGWFWSQRLIGQRAWPFAAASLLAPYLDQALARVLAALVGG